MKIYTIWCAIINIGNGVIFTTSGSSTLTYLYRYGAIWDRERSWKKIKREVGLSSPESVSESLYNYDILLIVISGNNRF